MPDARLLDHAAEIVSAHVSHNSVTPDALPGLIKTIYQTLAGLGTPTEVEIELVPAVPVKKSVFPDHIACLEDGKKLKMMKRHLQTSYNMTPDDYRKKWGLPASYPMVAPDYAAHRSTLAKKIGLGRPAKVPEFAVEPAVTKFAEGMSAKRKPKAKATA